MCAADLAGDEAAYPMEGFLELFGEVKKMDMPFTIHAGECGSAKNIKEAVEVGASRIGHGIAMREDPEVRRLCRERQIGIEMCPVSNLQTKAVPDRRENYGIKDEEIFRMMKNAVEVSFADEAVKDRLLRLYEI